MSGCGCVLLDQASGWQSWVESWGWARDRESDPGSLASLASIGQTNRHSTESRRTPKRFFYLWVGRVLALKGNQSPMRTRLFAKRSTSVNESGPVAAFREDRSLPKTLLSAPMLGKRVPRAIKQPKARKFRTYPLANRNHLPDVFTLCHVWGQRTAKSGVFSYPTPPSLPFKLGSLRTVRGLQTNRHPCILSRICPSDEASSKFQAQARNATIKGIKDASMRRGSYKGTPDQKKPGWLLVGVPLSVGSLF